MIKEWVKRFSFGLLFWLVNPGVTQAHESYVLSPQQWQASYQEPWFDLFMPLKDPSTVQLAMVAALVGIVLFLVSFFFWRSQPGLRLATSLTKMQPLAKWLLRVAVALALTIGAWHGQLFGPEIPLTALVGGHFLRYIIFALAILLILGWMTELAAAAVGLLYLLVLWTFGSYALIYLHYFIICLALVIFGAGHYSVDNWLPKTKRNLEPTLLRIGFGLALILGAILVKILHPSVALLVLDQYKPFPLSPTVSLLAVTLTELALGCFILFGAQTRSVAAALLACMLAAQFSFQEVLWPHLPLYALELYFVVVGSGYIAFDEWLAERGEI